MVPENVPFLATSSCPGTQGNGFCIFFVYDSLVMCIALFGLLYRLLRTGRRGQNPM